MDDFAGEPRGALGRTILITDINQWVMRLRLRDPLALQMIMNESRPSVLTTIVPIWIAERTPWAISEQIRYFQAGVVPRGHRGVVRWLIKAAAEAKHDRVMAAAMVFVDHLYGTAAFSTRTRAYLQRYVWRYMRSVARERPQEYCQVLSAALRAYPRISDALWGKDLLKRWCLLKACFGKHPALRFSSLGVYLQPDGEIQELASCLRTMAYSELWQSDDAQRQLHRLVSEARSPLIVHWAEEQLDVALSH